MKTAYIIHGYPDAEEYLSSDYPSPSNSHWLPWTQRLLLRQGYLCQTPEMPTPFDPVYENWKDAFSIYPITPDSILVGHSCGAGFLMRYLIENKKHVNQLILVAPWLDPKRTIGDFHAFTITPDLAKQIDHIHVLYSVDDPVQTVMQSVEIIKGALPNATYHEFNDMGHFTQSSMKSDQFNYLSDNILNVL